MKLLLTADPAAGTGQPDNSTAAPPAAAETVANGKTERELLLERENAKLHDDVQKTIGLKRQVEVKNAELEDELHRLKLSQSPPANPPKPAKEKISWMGFGAN